MNIKKMKKIQEKLLNYYDKVEEIRKNLFNLVQKELEKITELNFERYIADPNKIDFIAQDKDFKEIYVVFDYDTLRFIEVYDYSINKDYYDKIWEHFKRF